MKKMGAVLKSDFPIFKRTIHGHPLIYLDNAATTQKPQRVIDAMVDFYTLHNANIFRGIYTLAEEATALYEEARQKVASFIGADSEELVFTSGATEGINFVASVCLSLFSPNDELIITGLEHHSNILPWQRVAQQTGARLVTVPLNVDGTVAMDQFAQLVNKKTKLIAVSHVGNVLGSQQDLIAIIAMARSVGALVLIDAAQSVPHQPLDVHALDGDFLVFSGHKMLGPTGIGALYIRKELQENLPPYKVGGGMVTEVQFCSRWQKPPHKFEAGTPPIAAAIGLGAAVDYIAETIDFDQLQCHESLLRNRLVDGLMGLKRISVIGGIAQLKLSKYLVSFTVDGVHPHDVAAYCDSYGICVRAGVHCAQPLAQALGIGASVRVSFYAYNTPEDVDCLLDALTRLTGN
jgi:cysteine desulfurase / selenocysteine lyase